MSKETYKVKLKCLNCGAHWVTGVEIGNRVSQIIGCQIINEEDGDSKPIHCPTCKCAGKVVKDDKR